MQIFRVIYSSEVEAELFYRNICDNNKAE